MWHKNILETIGNTPMVKLNNITKDLPCTVVAKIESTNPGNSIKDRIQIQTVNFCFQLKVPDLSDPD